MGKIKFNMISYKWIKKRVGSVFWRHIHRETLVPYSGKIPNRERFLRELTENIVKMKYVPLPPRAYIVSHKQNLVVRFIPTMTKQDYCVYFFCIKCLENELAKNRVAGTYGGWRLGGKIRKIENFDDAPSMPDASYDKFAWMKAWSEFQEKARRFYSNKKFKYFIFFDIANFYDSVKLSRLEILLREATSKNKTPIINLLLYFLSNWGRRDLNYERQSGGLPQDEVGDCSRILANFYLQDYDKQIRQLASKSGAGYLRYADDQIIAARDGETARKLMFVASKELAKIGLNLTAKKVEIFDNRDDFAVYWSFDIFNLLINKEDKESIEEAFWLFEKRLKNNNIRFKPDRVLKRLLSCNLYRISPRVREKILKLVTKKNFLVDVNDYYLRRIYQFTPRSERKKFLKLLSKLSGEILFNQFHLRVIKFIRDKGIDKRYIDKVKINLNRLDALSG